MGPASLSMAHDRNVCVKRLMKFKVVDLIQIKFKDVFRHSKYHSDSTKRLLVKITSSLLLVQNITTI
jgi:hypothetical protein